MSARKRKLLAEAEAEEAADKSSGTGDPFGNYGSGNQSYEGPNSNSGALSGNRNGYVIIINRPCTHAKNRKMGPNGCVIL